MQMLATKPGNPAWQQIPCDVMHQQLPANCDADVEPGLPGGVGGYVPTCPGPVVKGRATKVPCSCTRAPPEGHFPCQGGEMPTAAVPASAQGYFAALETWPSL